MDINLVVPHPQGTITLTVTGASFSAAVASVHVAAEIANLIQQPEGAAFSPAAPAPAPAAPAAPAPAAPALAPATATAAPESLVSGRVDAAGVPFDPAIHTGTLRKDGTWRLRKSAKAHEADLEDETPETAAEPDFALVAESEPVVAEPEPVVANIEPISDLALQRFCGMVAAKLGGAAKVYEIASPFVPAGEVPRPSNIRDDASRWQFIRKAEEVSGVRFVHV